MTQRAGVFKRAAALVLAAAALGGCEYLLIIPPINLVVAPVWLPIRAIEAGIDCEGIDRPSESPTVWPRLPLGRANNPLIISAIDQTAPRPIGSGFTDLGGLRLDGPLTATRGVFMAIYDPLTFAVDPNSPKLLLGFGYGATEIELRSDSNGVVRSAAVTANLGIPEPGCFRSRPINRRIGTLRRLGDGRHAVARDDAIAMYPTTSPDAGPDRISVLGEPMRIDAPREGAFPYILPSTIGSLVVGIRSPWDRSAPESITWTLHEHTPGGWQKLATIRTRESDSLLSHCIRMADQLICLERRAPSETRRVIVSDDPLQCLPPRIHLACQEQVDRGEATWVLRRLRLPRDADRIVQPADWSDVTIPNAIFADRYDIQFAARVDANRRLLLYLLASKEPLSAEIRVLSLQ